jgi:integrase
VSDEVEKFLVDKLSAGLSKTTVGNLQIALSAVFKYAMRHDAGFAKNPAFGLAKELNLNEDSRRGVRALLNEELRSLLETAKALRPRVYTVLLTMARAGLRIGEVVALRWPDLDFDARLIRVERRHENRSPAALKTKRSRREVDMSLQLREELGRLKRLHLKDKLKFGWPELPVHCFVMPDGQPIRAKHVSYHFLLLLKKAGVPLYKEDIRLSPHCIRHTFACQLLLAGYSPS